MRDSAETFQQRMERLPKKGQLIEVQWRLHEGDPDETCYGSGEELQVFEQTGLELFTRTKILMCTTSTMTPLILGDLWTKTIPNV